MSLSHYVLKLLGPWIITSLSHYVFGLFGSGVVESFGSWVFEGDPMEQFNSWVILLAGFDIVYWGLGLVLFPRVIEE